MGGSELERRTSSEGDPSKRLEKLEDKQKWISGYLTSELGFRAEPNSPQTEGNVHRVSNNRKAKFEEQIVELKEGFDERIVTLNEDFEKKYQGHELILQGTPTTWGLVSRTKLLWSFIIPLWSAFGGLVSFGLIKLASKIF